MIEIKLDSLGRQISPEAEIGRDVDIGIHTKICGNVTIGDNSIIGSHCVIGDGGKDLSNKSVRLGKYSHIRSHNVLYSDIEADDELLTGHHVIIRENTKLGKNVKIGSYSDIEGDCTIGNFTHIHSDVHICQGAEIGKFVWLFPRVTFTNDPLPPSDIREPPKIKNMAVLSAGCLILPGVEIGIGSFVAAGSVVSKDVPDLSCVAGYPAKVFSTIDQLVNFKHGIRHPWPSHFRSSYSGEALRQLESEIDKVQKLIREK
ncbi:MAG: hypothetical protein IIB94_06465 [Candidatus Marinimicrobia bacterium]|nr:hypothetical protein [Candidatus Neomarinimicrobiota bacterium]